MTFLLLSIAIEIFCITSLFGSDSITGRDSPYRTMCLKASTSNYYFQNFRSFPDYYHALELQDGSAFASYISEKASEEIKQNIETFRRLDYLGKPLTAHYSKLGIFSAATLRYIVIADHIKKIFELPENPTIVEIGGGFGGQCYILSQLFAFSNYYIYDLPEVNSLIEKMMKMLNVQQTICLSTNATLPEEKIDLFISNYSFSECDKATQLDYFDRVIKKAGRGYVIYNQTSDIYDVSSLSPNEFITLLEKNGIHPFVYEEPIKTFNGNVLIIW